MNPVLVIAAVLVALLCGALAVPLVLAEARVLVQLPDVGWFRCFDLEQWKQP